MFFMYGSVACIMTSNKPGNLAFKSSSRIEMKRCVPSRRVYITPDSRKTLKW